MASNKRTAAKSQGQYAEKPKGMSATRNELSIHLQPSTPCKYTIDDLNVAHAEYLPNGQLDVENSTYKDAESALRVGIANMADGENSVDFWCDSEGTFNVRFTDIEKESAYLDNAYRDSDTASLQTLDGDTLPDWFTRNKNTDYDKECRKLQPVREFLDGEAYEIHLEEFQAPLGYPQNEGIGQANDDWVVVADYYPNGTERKA